ncbi:putative Erythrocyte binding protein [Balamuthia mandrillaris]
MEGASAATTFKIFFQASTATADSTPDIRRISLPSARPTFAEFVKTLTELYSPSQLFHPELSIKYVDNEGDKCTVASEAEWEAMLEHTRENLGGGANPIFKIYVVEGPNKGQYFKDGPPAEVKHVYSTSTSSSSSSSAASSSSSGSCCSATACSSATPNLLLRVPPCLEGLFPGGRILPYNLPLWLERCVTKRKVALNEVELDINIPALMQSLHNQAVALLKKDNEERNKEAKNFLLCLLSINPSNAYALYNLACAESLMGNQEAAVEALTKAVMDGGYNNLQHMQQDADLDNIRENPGYLALIAHLSGGNAEQKEEKEEEAEKEEEEAKKEDVKVEEPEAKEEEQPVHEEETELEKNKEEVKEEKEEKKEEEKNEVSPWEPQLQKLAEMGFTNRGYLELLLAENKGNVEKVLLVLFP